MSEPVNEPADCANPPEAFNEPKDALANVEPKVECSYSVSINPPTGGLLRVFKTVSLFANLFFLLPACKQTNAALVDLASLYSVSLAAISVYQPVNCISYISGTWIGSLVYSRVNSFGLLTAFSALLMAGLAMCSFMPNVLLFFGASGLGAVAEGAIDTIANSHFLAMWEGHRIRDSMLQGLHAAWSAGVMGLGAALKSFLDPNLTSIKANASQLASDDAQLPPYSGRVQFAYILFASLGVIPLCSHIGLLVWDRCGPTTRPRRRSADVLASEDGKSGGRTKRLLAGRPALIMVAFAVSMRVFDASAF
uniref:MFS domain-containing protein n=1 Tax=Macrostomum lignano TaxID=282301 RepID=A0A1I8FVR8_9PLAT